MEPRPTALGTRCRRTPRHRTTDPRKGHTTTTDHPDPIDALAGEVYVELVSGYHVPPHQVSFPAVVDERRRNGLWARPRFRREVAEAVAEWLNLVYPLDPDWYPLARLDGDTFLIIRGDSPHQHHAVEPDDDGRYALGPDDGSWFLSIPTLTTAAQAAETELLGDPRRRITTQGEILVSCMADDLIAGAFPATVDPPRPDGTVVPTFRPEIVAVLAAWCNKRHRADPDQYPQAYFDHGVLVHVDQHLRALDGYLPWRITPGPGSHYRIDGDEWAFYRAPDSPTVFTLRPPGSRRRPRVTRSLT